MIVRVCFVVRNWIELIERLLPTGLINSDQQFVLLWVVAFRHWERNSILQMIGRAPAIAVGLNSFVACTIFTGRFRADLWQNARRRISRNHIRTDFGLQCTEVMSMMQDACLNTVPVFVIDRVRFSPNMVRNSCGRHQITFVRRVDKHPAAKGLAG